MPAQTAAALVQYYAQGDTAPDLVSRLLDGAKKPIDLTGATVVINIAYQRFSFYYSPTTRIVDGGVCVVDPDQTEDGNRGFVSWTPQPGDLNPAGVFLYTFEVTYPNGTRQTVAPNTYEALIIKTPVGGQRFAS